MYMFLALFSGVALSAMISINGGLTARYGTFCAAAVIHIVGSLAALFACAFQGEKKKLWGQGPVWAYLGGAIGVLTTVFQNFAFGRISITSIVALALLGQTCASLLVDRFGLLGMQKQPVKKQSAIGLALALLGIVVMLDNTVSAAILAAVVSFVSGVTIVLSRTFNARLAEKTGALRGSLINHLVGLPITIVLALLAAPAVSFAGGPWWIYLGGVLGVLVVMLCNVVVPKISAFRMTLLEFTGQVFAGIALDVLLGGAYPRSSFAGGVLIAAGIAVNLALEKRGAAKEKSGR